MVLLADMAWLVGIDLRSERAGVLQFAAWLRQHTAEDLIGVHVMERDPHSDSEVRQRAQQALLESIERQKLGDSFSNLLVVEGSSVQEALYEACVSKQTSGLVVGRRVGVDEAGWVRIGAVTRHLLRSLPAPVIVVPPDLDPGTLGDGPLVLGIDEPSNPSMRSYQFAAKMAEATGRELELAAIASPLRSASVYLPAMLLAQRQQHRVEQAREAVRQWMGEHGIQATLRVLSGRPMEQILAQAEEVQAPLVVCCRNKSGALQRYLGGSTSTDLVTHSRVPVAVVADFE